MVMTLDALSKELYSLKQGSGENMAKSGVCLSQVQRIKCNSFSVTREFVCLPKVEGQSYLYC